MLSNTVSGSDYPNCMERPFIAADNSLHASDDRSMLTEFYIEALLADENLADQVWELWDKRRTGFDCLVAGRYFFCNLPVS